MKKFSIIAVALCVILVQGWPAQAQELFTLDRTLETAFENNPDIIQSELGLERSRQSLIAQRASLKSQFSLNVNPISYNSGRRFDMSKNQWINTENFSSSGAFKIVQPITATDGTVSFTNTFGWDYNENNNSVNPITKEFSNDTRIRYDQPIFTYNKTKMALQELELDLENTLLSHAISKLNIEKQVTQYFYVVYQRQQSLMISKEELENQEGNYEIIKNKVDAGLTAQEELWQAELNLQNARSSVYSAEVSHENAKDNLRRALNISFDQELDVLANVDVKKVDVKMEDAINYAINQRMELRQREITIQNSQFSLIKTNALNEFKGNIGLSLGITGSDPALEGIYNNAALSPSLDVSFEIPLWDWGEKEARLKAAEASLKKNELNFEQEKIDIILNIRSVYRNLENLAIQIDIAEKSVENAQKTYELNVEKYENGDLTSMDLSLYQNQLSSKKNALTNALIDYKLEILNLKIQTLWDFEKNESIVPTEFLLQNQL